VKRVTIEIQAERGLTVMLTLTGRMKATVEGVAELVVKHRER
jgi:hypothetical protein